MNSLRCTKCKSELQEQANGLACLSCGKTYPIVHGVPDFRPKDEYWCNVSREKMRELNDLARTSNDWLSAAKKLLPSYSEHFIPFYRADSQFLWPTDSNSVILDAGSMWGGISVPAAQFHKEVYAVDKTLETLEFLDIRAKQMGFTNVHCIGASLEKLPFPDNFFDMVVLSGVLEWVGVQDDVDLEQQWNRTGRGIKLSQKEHYKKTPRAMQLEALKEIRRVLKPSGHIFLAIENSVGFIYLAGWPDEHMNLPFLSFLPRFLSNIITKLALGSEYRTYVYDIPGYKKLLKEAGFGKGFFYGVFNHYINAKEIIPVSLVKGLKGKIFQGKDWRLRLLSRFIPAGMLAYLSPSIMAFASKEEGEAYEPRLKRVFREAGIITDTLADFKALKWDGRKDNALPVNYVVYINGKPAYFCKIARGTEGVVTVSHEAEHLRALNKALYGTLLAPRVPKLVYHGTVDGVTVLVTTYVPGDLAMPPLWLQKISTKLWLKKTDRPVKAALSFLNDFQKTGMEHGDYDLCNLLVQGETLSVIDFEHLAEAKNSYLDLGNLFFNYLLVQWKALGRPGTLRSFAKTSGWEKQIREWTEYYSSISGVSMDVLRHLPALAVREQNSRIYPPSRDPKTFPMYGQDIIDEMTSWTL